MRGGERVDVNKLRGKIVEMGLNVETLAKRIGIDRSTLYRKLNRDGDTLTVREVNIICKELKLTKEEAMDIFFKNFVA